MENEKQFTLWDQILHYFEMAMKIFETMEGNLQNQEFVDMFFNYFKKLRVAKEENKPIVMTNFCLPPEIIYAMNCYPMCQEIGSVALSIANAGLKYIDIAEEKGIDKFQCNAQKVWIGASMVEEAPFPDYIIYGSQPCDSTNSQYQVLRRIYDKASVYTIDIPYWHYDPQNKYFDANTIPYVAQQLKNLVPWLEEKTNSKMDHEHFINTIKNSNT
ncbi:MAG: 2-hydroxyacyl-CoA dehydratase, partial [Promethearchaeota archaeon]